MSEWREVILQDVVEKFIDYRGKTPRKTTSGIALVTAKIVKNGTILEPNEFVSEKTYNSFMTRGFPKINDVVLTTEAPLGEVALIKDDGVALAQRIILIRGKKDILDNVFLKYFLQSEEGQYRLDSRASGTTVFGIKASVLKEMPVLIPPLKEQKAIAEVLSSLDDKIDLLHRQNKTLEEMAQTLFRQWFVEGADEGWEEKSLFDSIVIIGGGTPQTTKNQYWNGSIPWLSGGDISAHHKSIVIKTEKTITEEGLKNSSTKLLPKYATIISARGTVGKYSLLAKEMAFSQSNYGILPKFDNCYFFTYLLIASSIEYLQSAAYGSIFDTITTKTFQEHTIALPNKNKIYKFENDVKAYFIKIENNKKQIQTLEKMRDTLLPKLMSGEVRVGR